MSDLNIGVAHISIEPTANTFQAQADQKIKQALAPLKPGVNIQPNLNQAALNKSIAQVKAELNVLTHGNDVIVNGNTSALSAKLAALEAQAAGLNATLNKGGQSNLLGQASLAEAVNDLGKMDGRLQQIKQDMADSGTTGTAAFHAIAAAVATAQRQLADMKYNGVINANDIEQVANLDKALSKLEGTLGSTGDSADSAGSRVGGMFSILSKITSVSIPLFAKSMDDVSGSVIPGFGDVLMEMMPHMLSYASGVHMMMEAAIEFTAVWLPAGVAIAGFVLAAVPEIIDVSRELDHMHQVAISTGATFADYPKLTGGITAALKPQLLELYGIALQGIDSSSGKLGPALDTVATGIDNVAARIVAWTQNSKGGLENFIKSGAQDAGLLADAFVQLGRILQTVLQSVPGYAKMLLEFGDACLTVLADVTRFIQPAIALFLKLHGAIFYLGLATTMVAAFGNSMLVAAAKTTVMGTAMDAPTGKIAKLGAYFGTMIGNLVNLGKYTVAYAATLITLAEKEGIASAASAAMEGAMGAIPFGPVGLAVAAFSAVVGFGLFEAFTNTATAAQKFNAQMQKTVTSANYLDLQQAIQSAISQTGAKLTQVTNLYQQASNNLNQNTKAAHDNAAAYGGQAQMLTAQRTAMTQLSSGLGLLIQQSAIASTRQQDLAKSYGGTDQALGLMNLAGVKASTLATDSASQYQLLKIQLSGVAQGYGLMSQQAGAAGAELDTINISTSDAVKAMSNLTSAESAWTTMITGGVNALSSFESGITGLTKVTTTYTSATKTTAASTKTTATTTAGLAKVTHQSTEATLAQQAAFAQQVTAGTSVLTSLQQLSQASGNTAKSQGEVTSAMKSLVGQMLPFAKGSATNTAMLSSLAQLVGGPATDNFQTLAKWVGNTKDAQANLTKQTDELTISSANLTNAEKNLASTLSDDITQAQAAAIMTNSLQTATNNMYKAMQTSNDTLTTSVKLTGTDYFNALVKAGLGTQGATQYVDAFMKQQGYTQTAINAMNKYLDQQATKLQGVQGAAKNAQTALKDYAQGSPYNATVNTTVGADGTVQVTGKGAGLNDVLAHISFRGQGFSGGGVVPGASAGGDNQLAMVKSGELIIPSQHAARFGSMAKAAGIPGFASGGVVGAVSAVSNTDQQGMQAGAQQSMTQAVKDLTSYVKNQSSTGGSPVNYSPTAGVNQWKSVVLQALAMNGLPASLLNQVLYQMQTESGGNPNAQNNWDSNAAAGDPSRGLLQTIGSTFSAYHIAGTSENIFNPLANVAAAINYAKHVYGPSLMSGGMGMGSGHGYAAGGVIPEKVMGVGVNTGMPYAFGSGEQVTPAGEANAANGLTGNIGLLVPLFQRANQLLERQNQIMANQGPQYARGLNNAASSGANRAYFATGG